MTTIFRDGESLNSSEMSIRPDAFLMKLHEMDMEGIEKGGGSGGWGRSGPERG